MVHPELYMQRHPHCHILPFGSLLLDPFAKPLQTVHHRPHTSAQDPPPQAGSDPALLGVTWGAPKGSCSRWCRAPQWLQAHQEEQDTTPGSAASVCHVPAPSRRAGIAGHFGTRMRNPPRASPLELCQEQRVQGSIQGCLRCTPWHSSCPKDARTRVPPTTREANTPAARHAADPLRVSATGEV